MRDGATAISVDQRGRLIDAWLAHYEAEHGAFSEDELRAIAHDAGVPYVPAADPGSTQPA